MKQKILIVLVPAFDPNKGGVQMSTRKLANYFKDQGLDVAIFSFTHDGHIPSEDISIFNATQPGLNYNQANLLALKTLILSWQPSIVINQMPYEFNVGLLLRELKSELSFLLLACLRGSFFAVKQNLETYRKTLLP